MNAVLSLTFVTGSALGVLLVAMLLAKKHRSQTNLLLACLILIVSMDVSVSAIKHLLPMQTLPALLRLTSFPELLFAPLLYLYFRAQHDATPLTWRQFWHFAFFALFQLVAVYELEQPSLLPWLTIHSYLNLCSLLLIGIYVLASLRLMKASLLQYGDSVFHNQTLVLTALLAALGSYLLATGAGVWNFQLEDVQLADMMDVVLSASLIVLACSAFYYRVFCSSSKNHVIDSQILCIEPGFDVEKEKYGNNRLPEFIRESIIDGLNSYMRRAQPWLQTDLTLSELATSINVNPHHLSQIINSEFGKSFACYINEHRINEACKLLSNDSDKTILEIALQSGFSSKSSFNTLFKKQTGLTPSEYRKKFQSSNCVAA